MKTLVNKALKWVFEIVLRRKLGLKKGPIGENIKWYESENVWAGIAVAAYSIYMIVKGVAEDHFGAKLPEIPPEYLAYIGTLLGGGIVWSRMTAEKKIQ